MKYAPIVMLIARLWAIAFREFWAQVMICGVLLGAEGVVELYEGRQ